MTYTIMFYRNQDWAERFEKAGVYKPEGMQQSKIPYRNKVDATVAAEHVNAFEPEYPCVVVELRS